MSFASSSEYDSHDYPRITPAVQWLIAANVAVFFLQLTMVGSDGMWNALGFELRRLDRWWTILTYMFVHGGFWHVAMNMYFLWLFGPRVEHSWTPASFAGYFFWCGLGAWLFHLLFQGGGLLIGASGAVYGVMLAYALRWPNDEIYLFGIVPMKVKWLVTFLVLINLVHGLAGTGPISGVAYFAHLGGMAFGWLYLRTPSAQSLERLKQRMSQLPDVPDGEAPRAVPRLLPRRARRDEEEDVVARSRAAVGKRPSRERGRTRTDTPERMEALNLVLDKIAEQGLESLTGDERKLLEEMSRRLRER